MATSIVVDPITLRTVARRTVSWPFQVWGFGEAIALRGLLAASRRLDTPDIYQFVYRLLLSYAERPGVGTSFAEHVAPGRELVVLYEESRNERFLEAARRLAALHASCVVGAGGARIHRSDLSGWRRQIWVDCMDNEPPFLVRLGRVTAEERYVEQGVNEIVAYARLLQDERTGLFRHGYEAPHGPNGQIWARGNGWALMGLVETLRLLPDDAAPRQELCERLQHLCDGLARVQDESGLWHTIADGPDTYLESTLAAMVAASIPAAAGLVSEPRFREMATRAHRAVLALIAADGALQGVTEATPVAERSMYATRQCGVYPWGQGPLLLMLTETGDEPRVG